MKEENASYIWFACFFFFIVILVLIGSFLLYRNHNLKFRSTDTEGQNVLVSDKMKKNKEKDYIYYEMEENFSSSFDFSYKKAVFNFASEDAKEVNLELSKIYDDAFSTIIKSNTTDHVCANGSDLYASSLLDYAMYAYQEYITLVVTESRYSCTDSITKPLKIHAYTFNVLTGKLISFDELLKRSHFTYTELLDKIEKQLQSSQTIDEETPNIKIEETLNELKKNETYVIYLSETNQLVVKYIVKTNSVDYNDVIELN